MNKFINWSDFPISGNLENSNIFEHLMDIHDFKYSNVWTYFEDSKELQHFNKHMGVKTLKNDVADQIDLKDLVYCCDLQYLTSLICFQNQRSTRHATNYEIFKV